VDYFFATFIDFPNNILSIFVSLHREFVKHLMQINEKFHNVCMRHFIVLVGGKLWKRWSKPKLLLVWGVNHNLGVKEKHALNNTPAGQEVPFGDSVMKLHPESLTG
jgi:hypothetical protein